MVTEKGSKCKTDKQAVSRDSYIDRVLNKVGYN